MPKSYKIIHYIPRQFSDPEFGKKFKTSVENAEKSIKGTLIMTIITNLLLAGTISLIWSFVNALQMLMFLAMCEISFPSTVKTLYKVLIPLASLDIIPSELSTDLFFTFSENMDYPYNSKFEDLGFDSHNMVKNLGSMFYYIMVLFIMMILSLILDRCKIENKCMQQMKENIKYFMIINQLFIVIQEGFIEILVSCYLNLQNPIMITFSDKLSNVLNIIIFIISLTVIPSSIIFTMTREETTLKLKESNEKYGGTYENLKINSKFNLFYNLLFIIRRMILVFLLFNQFFVSYVSF